MTTFIPTIPDARFRVAYVRLGEIAIFVPPGSIPARTPWARVPGTWVILIGPVDEPLAQLIENNTNDQLLQMLGLYPKALRALRLHLGIAEIRPGAPRRGGSRKGGAHRGPEKSGYSLKDFYRLRREYWAAPTESTLVAIQAQVREGQRRGSVWASKPTAVKWLAMEKAGGNKAAHLQPRPH